MQLLTLTMFEVQFHSSTAQHRGVCNQGIKDYTKSFGVNRDNSPVLTIIPHTETKTTEIFPMFFLIGKYY